MSTSVGESPPVPCSPELGCAWWTSRSGHLYWCAGDGWEPADDRSVGTNPNGMRLPPSPTEPGTHWYAMGYEFIWEIDDDGVGQWKRTGENYHHVPRRS